MNKNGFLFPLELLGLTPQIRWFLQSDYPIWAPNEIRWINERMAKEPDEGESSGLRIWLPPTAMLPRFGVALVPLQPPFNDRGAS